jgi:hypothetical protein
VSNGIHMKCVYSRSRTAGTEDVAVTTHDLYWAGTGDGTDALCDQIADKYSTFWTALNSSSPTPSVIANNVTLVEYRFYRGYNGDGTPGAVDYVKTVSSPGTSTSSMLPPQIATTITELTDERRHWGRFYLPGLSLEALADDGSMSNAAITKIINAAETMYEAWGAITDVTPIVWTRTSHPISYNAMAPPRWRPTWLFPSGTSYSAPAALAVQSIRIDEILDTQRRRRWESAQLRVTRQLA